MVQTPLFGHFWARLSFWAFVDPFWPVGCGRGVKTGGSRWPFETIFGDFFRATWLEALGMGARFAHSRG